MELKVSGAEDVQVSDKAFAAAFNESIVHQAVVAFLTTARQGSKAQKNRAAVRGGGSKPWRQKGTGRARAGTIRSPLWRGGGRTFAAVPRSHKHKLNKKMYRGALRSILSELVRQNRLVIVDQFTVDTPKTKNVIAKLNQLNISGELNALIVASEVQQNVSLAVRNIPYVEARDVHGVDPVSLIAHEKIIMTVDAIKKFEELL